MPALWGDVHEHLAAAGAPEIPSYYGKFTSPDEKAVLSVPMRVHAAFTAKDGDAFADVFTENGSLVQFDDELSGREAIRAYMRAGFAGPLRDFRISGYGLGLRFVSDDVAIFAEMAGVLLPGETEVAPERSLRATWVIVRRGGQLSLMSFHASPVRD